jgi:hypothetical protein
MKAPHCNGGCGTVTRRPSRPPCSNKLCQGRHSATKRPVNGGARFGRALNTSALGSSPVESATPARIVTARRRSRAGQVGDRNGRSPAYLHDKVPIELVPDGDVRGSSQDNGKNGSNACSARRGVQTGSCAEPAPRGRVRHPIRPGMTMDRVGHVRSVARDSAL